ncbi:MAG TPA: alpha/beta hydrolase [Pseudonocardia sp.]|nr:alpha/beta hydrolase [Pseudonocardia sp.]
MLSGGRVVSPDGTRLGFLRIGSGPLVLCVHGALATGLDWLPVARLLADRYTFVLADRRGHGVSDAGSVTDPLAAEIGDLTAFIDAVGPVHCLVSHSFGSVVAMHTMLTPAGDAVDKLVVYEPPLMLDPVALSATVRRARELLDQGHYEEALRQVMCESMGLSEPLLASMQRDPLSWAGFVASTPVVVAETEAMAGVASAAEPFRAIRQPTLLLRGGQSRLEHFVRSVEALAVTITDARVVQLPDQGHLAMIQDPEQFAGTLLEFLEPAR